jgi:hypothetical protein
MPSVWRGHDLTWSVALDLSRCIASGARDRITFMSDVLIAQLNGGWHGLNDAVNSRFVAVQNQISFHGARVVVTRYKQW